MEPRRETELGELPASWRVGPLGEFLSKTQYGASVKGTSSGGQPILRMTNQVNGRISSANLQYAEVPARDLENFRVQRGDILFNRTNSFELVGRTAIFDLDGDYLFASYLIRLQTLKAVLDPFFLNAYLNAHETQRRLKGIATRAVSQSNISASRLRTFVVPVPPLDEQRKIAMILDVVQRAIEHQDRLLALTMELKKALLQKLFTQGLRSEPQRQTEIGPIPSNWKVVTIGELFKFSSGKSRPTDTEPTTSESKPFPVFGGNGVLGYSGVFLLEEPVLLLGRVGEYCGCVHHTEGRAWVSDNALYAKEISDAIDSHYATEYFTHANMNQYSSRAGQPLITQGTISRVKMPLPSVDEQKMILEPLQLLNDKMKQHRAKHARLRALFRTLLHHLMTAQIRVNYLNLSDLYQEAI